MSDCHDIEVGPPTVSTNLLKHGDPNQGAALAASLDAKSKEGTDPHD